MRNIQAEMEALDAIINEDGALDRLIQIYGEAAFSADVLSIVNKALDAVNDDDGRSTGSNRVKWEAIAEEADAAIDDILAELDWEANS